MLAQFVDARIEVVATYVECRYFERLQASYEKSAAVGISQFGPADISVVAAFLRADIAETHVGHIA